MSFVYKIEPKEVDDALINKHWSHVMQEKLKIILKETTFGNSFPKLRLLK